MVVAKFCEILGLPHASYLLATASIKRDDELWDFQRGVITDSFYTRQSETLIDGDQLLLERDADYPTAERYKLSQYTLPAVANVIAELSLPPEQFCGDLPTREFCIELVTVNQHRIRETWNQRK